jgi:hypothetical protein
MRTKAGIGVLIVAVLVSCLVFSTVHAQVTYTIWQGSWFKINLVSKGYERNIGGTPEWSPLNGRFTAFLNIGAWTDPGGPEGNETFAADIIYSDEAGGWTYVPVTLHRIHGNPLDIFIWSQTDNGNIAAGTGSRIGFLARISGKLDKAGTSLQTGTFKSLAGYNIEMNPTDPLGPLYEPMSLTMTGTLIIPATFCKSKANQNYPPCLP